MLHDDVQLNEGVDAKVLRISPLCTRVAARYSRAARVDEPADSIAEG